jgi:hypothetical protein
MLSQTGDRHIPSHVMAVSRMREFRRWICPVGDCSLILNNPFAAAGLVICVRPPHFEDMTEPRLPCGKA